MSENVKNVTVEQLDLIETLRENVPGITVYWDNVRGVASSIRGDLWKLVEEKKEPKDILTAFLKIYSPLFGPRGFFPENAKLLRERRDELEFEHIFYLQTHPLMELKKELEVYGSKLAAHIDEHKRLIEVQSSFWRDVKVERKIEVAREEVGRRMLELLEPLKGFSDIQKSERENKDFPLTDEPHLVIYPWKNQYRLAWVSYGYGPIQQMEGLPNETGITYGQIFLDATTGELLLFSPTIYFVENPDTGSGLAVTPITPPHSTRTLNIVREGTTSTYRLKDTTLNREIITYDTACSTQYDSATEIFNAIDNGTMPVSEDTDGDKNWNRLPSNTTSAQRTSGQQPEVDAHYFARRQYLWYDALAGGRDGWDDGKYNDPPVPNQQINIIAHNLGPPGYGLNCQSVNALATIAKAGGIWKTWLAFMDGDGTTFDYIAGSHFLFAHEYQHAITNYSFEDGVGDPGLTITGWLGAVHEGLSDVFSGLSTEQWLNGVDISLQTPPQVFRNLVYPRDSNAFSANRFDHFDDRNTSTSIYSRGTILAHCAYLMGAGGVHERTFRTPTLIPVYGLGRQTVGGLNVLKAARIWYRALTVYFSTHGNLTAEPANNENSFRTLRNACTSAAIDLYGSGSREHLTTVLAFYAVGLHPTGSNYGADPTFLRWGSSWRLSRPYIGLNSPDWASLDLFINNGGISEWNAIINITDSSGNPTQFENTIYCRVRNVGDQDAHNVQVNFFYAKVGTGVTGWLPVTDKDGNVQTLNVGTLLAGESTFPDSAQNSPPASSSRKWYIPPLSPGETVHHFCLRAEVTSSDDVNQWNNDVQSNISYVAYTPATGAQLAFFVGNPTKEKIPVELRVVKELPRDWHVFIPEELKDRWLEPGEEKEIELKIQMPSGADRHLAPPLDGSITGEAYGEISGPITGVLTETYWNKRILKGRLSAMLVELGKIVGIFHGRLNTITGEIQGRVTGEFYCEGGGKREKICIGIKACLRPWRRLNISQIVNNEQIGGITVQVQVPSISETCAEKIPPTDTHITKNYFLQKERIRPDIRQII